MSTMDEYYYWQKWGKTYDPHKYDYLHAESLDAEMVSEWSYRSECLCDGCFLWKQVSYTSMRVFLEDYLELKRTMEQFPGFDRVAAFNLMIADEDECIF